MGFWSRCVMQHLERGIFMQLQTYADLVRPNTKALAFLYDAVLVILGSLALSLSNLIRLYIIPGSPVPITGQTFAVILLGALLGSKRAPAAAGLYLLYGVAGLPWYSGGLLFGPTGGYLVGFIAAAALTGFLAEQGMDRKYFTAVVAMVIGDVMLFAFGMIWLSCFVKGNVFALGLFPFIPGEIIKIALASALLPSGWKLLAKLKK